jgi:hypothetical protein
MTPIFTTANAQKLFSVENIGGFGNLAPNKQTKLRAIGTHYGTLVQEVLAGNPPAEWANGLVSDMYGTYSKTVAAIAHGSIGNG